MNYYPHHIGDFNSATRHLTRVERSLYRDLIELYYDTEQPLPADDFGRLARRVIALSEEERSALQYVLDEFFDLDDDVYRNSRCDEEIAKYHANNSAKAKAGKASAEARRKKAQAQKEQKRTNDKQAATGVEHPLNGCATNQEPRTINQEPLKEMASSGDDTDPPPDDDSPEKRKRFSAKRVDLPPSVDTDNWVRWCEFRSSKRKPISGQAARQQIAMLAEHSPDAQRAIVQNSIQNDYQGLFAPKGGSHAANQPTDRPRSAVDRVRAATAERERQRVLREGHGSPLGAHDGDLRSPLDQRVWGDSGTGVGDCLEGDFTRENQIGAGANGG